MSWRAILINVAVSLSAALALKITAIVNGSQLAYGFAVLCAGYALFMLGYLCGQPADVLVASRGSSLRRTTPD